jgi:two-component sensor histidine kinase
MAADSEVNSPAQQAPAPQHWWRRAPRVPTLALLAVVALALLGSFTLIFATVETERTQRVQATRTAGVIAALNGIVSASLNGETGQRGYFITNDERYLQPFYEGRRAYRSARVTLRQRIGNELDDHQIALLDEIERLGDAKWAELSSTIALIQQGRVVDAHQRILTDEGQLAMQGLRRAVARLDDLEQGRLAAASDAASTAEGRIVPLLSLLFVIIVIALGLGLWQAVRTAHAETAAANAQEIAEARDRADLLARELNHRVKNLFAVILAIVKMSARGDAAAAPAVDRIAKRIHALVTAHDVTQGSRGDSHVDLAELVAKTIAPYRSTSEQGEITGGSMIVAGRHAVPLGLVLHELVTNAVKYGAWAQPGGLLSIDWREEDGRVRLVWKEQSPAPSAPPAVNADGRLEHEGFGSMLLRSSERQLGGTIRRRFEPAGVVVEIEFPKGA